MDRELVRFSDVKDAGFCKRFLNLELPQRCEELGWEVVENHEDDILDLCKDMVDSLEGIRTAPEVRTLQKYYQDQFHDYFGQDSGVGFIAPRFALKYRALII